MGTQPATHPELTFFLTLNSFYTVVCMCVYSTPHVWRSDNNFKKSIRSFHFHEGGFQRSKYDVRLVAKRLFHVQSSTDDWQTQWFAKVELCSIFHSACPRLLTHGLEERCYSLFLASKPKLQKVTQLTCTQASQQLSQVHP